MVPLRITLARSTIIYAEFKQALQPLQAIKVSNIATTIARFISDLLIPP